MSLMWRPPQHADHVSIVLANSKARLVPALICRLTIITPSSKLWAHTASTMHSSYLCLLETHTVQENQIASNMFTAFSGTLAAGPLIEECGGAQKLRGSELLLEKIAAQAEVFDMWVCRPVCSLLIVFYSTETVSCCSFMALCLKSERCCMRFRGLTHNFTFQ